MLVPDLYETELIVRSMADILWVVIALSLVFLQQAGFTCLESGLARAQNSTNVAAGWKTTEDPRQQLADGGARNALNTDEWVWF